MVEAVGREQILRIAGNQYIWLDLADHTDHLAAEVDIGDQVAIRALQPVDGFRTDDGSGRLLLPVANGAQGIRGHILRGRIVKAFIAASEKVINDLVAGTRPMGKGGTAEKLGVVRMSQNNKDAPGRIPDAGGGGFIAHGNERD